MVAGALLCCCFSCTVTADDPDSAFYSITYNLNGGSWREGYTAPETYTAQVSLMLPDAASIVRDGYTFAGWYDNKELTGFSFFCVGSGSPKTVWAKWIENITVSAADAATAIAALTSEKSPCMVVLTEALSKADISAIKTALTTAGGAGAIVALDMSACIGLDALPPEAFEDCSSLRSVTIPAGVTSIGDSAFDGCDSLRSVTIPDGVMSIGDSAFSVCRTLGSVTIPNSVTSIGDSAFFACHSLSSVTIPNNVTSIGRFAFDSCSSLTSLTFSDPANWYRTTLLSDWNSKANGTLTTLPGASANVTYFTSTYVKYYWYKLY